ncbi:IclR family transcriptional regulator [Haloarcula onubensis]|uniref:IclR family transcriptional regulator n=1 Tax=Haloarcula onubensis TaxID=2950539 RepID=A0ABU2FND9_9EURY|nr:IclR family transcriptional regulator [Halomicroarcula sp. S3CR25-11]MDS0281929.1 IclR family transcriptional regulator [Halomicroarcula sp. S3CR25-11]
MTNDTQTRTLQTTRTTLEIVRALEEHGPVRVTELADRLDMASSTVHSHLATLVGEEFVTKDGDFYRLSLEFLRLGIHARNLRDEHQVVQSYTEQLAEETDCRAVFLVEEHGRGVYLYTNSGKHAVWSYSTVGKQAPLHVTASGKAILASLPRQRVDEIIDRRGLAPETDQSITDRDELYAELDEIRDRGFAFNREEQLDGIKAVGVPVSGPDDRVIGSFSAASPAKRMDDEWFETELPNQVLGIANEFELEISMP